MESSSCFVVPPLDTTVLSSSRERKTNPPTPLEPGEDMEREFQRLAEASGSEKLSARENEEAYIEATAPCNIHKNRYRDVLPLGFNGNVPTRVRLQPILGVEGSEYINANYIDIRDKRYIACQAPIPHTFADFWRMVWEQEVTVIVMLTSLVECDRVKAHAYWPAVDKTHRFGALAVTLLEESYECGVMTRKLSITKLEDDSTRQVTQLHFCEWPDHGVPRSSAGIRRILHLSHYYSRLHQHQQGLAGPIVVHCSAGIGRAGTFIAIDVMLDVLHSRRLREPDDGSPKTVFDTVRYLRQRRRGMIQTLEQYKFIFRVLEECRTSPIDGVSASDDWETTVDTPPTRLLRSSAANILRLTGVNLPHHRPSLKESAVFGVAGTPSSHETPTGSPVVGGGLGGSLPNSTSPPNSASTAKKHLLSLHNSSPSRPVRKLASSSARVVGIGASSCLLTDGILK